MADPRVKMLHFTCTTCRDKQVNTLFCTLVQPRHCTCPYFVDMDEGCKGPEGEGLLHILHPLDNIEVKEEEQKQFMIPTYRQMDGAEDETVGSQWVFAMVDHVYCTQCDTMIGYRFIRMIGAGADHEKLSIVGDKMKIVDINSDYPIPSFLLDSDKVTKFLTKRK